ncbi:SGNH/GDSL hydrolase family protein [Candidatus Saccharibacteria bacterium]|nr:SGNH/GDSL hydrolase family protein [Candidatus Saccharibacteria bacterium]
MFGMVVRGIVLAIVGSALLGSSALATNGNLWHSNQEFPVTVSDSASYPTNQFWMAGCTLSWSPVMQKDGTTLRERICVFHGSRLSMGSYTDADRQRYYVMKIGTDTVYRQIANINGYTGRVFLRPADDTLIVHFPGPQYGTSPRFSLFSLANNAFTPEMSDVGFSVWRYSLDRSKADTLLGLEVSGGSVYNPAHNGYTFSPNRQYLLARMEDNAVVVANTTTGDMKAIDIMRSSGIIDFAVSDDGAYATYGTSGRIWHNEACGDRYDYAFHLYAKSQSRTPFANACDMTIVYDEINPPGRFGSWGAIFYFSDNNTTLSFDYPRANPTHHGKIQTQAYHPNQLDYLALGDSYSSGEGDVEEKSDGSSYYTPVTDTEGGCHMSTRSYPFLLRDAWGINDEKMESVACSGAKISPDYNSLLSSYKGQGGRLNDVDDDRRAELQERALDVFIPGYTTQLEFVKKYQPKTITLTGAGNDVGFVDILKYCAADVLESTQGYSCEYVEGGLLNGILWDSIHSIKSRVVELVQQIQTLSPNSEVNIIGYPSFIAGSESVCALNNGTINGPERDMMNDAVSELNRVLKAVADETEVTYIDIENSLVGGRLCEGSEYVTGLWFERYYNEVERSNAFHPNAEGHKMMAANVISALSGHVDQPVVDQESDDNTAVQQYAYWDDLISEGSVLSMDSNVSIESSTQTFQDGSTITVAIFSERTDLGIFTATEQGSLSATVDLNSIEPGRHVLVAEGVSPSGDTVVLYQFITIVVDVDDFDGDGILNDFDDCMFIDAWYDEKTGINVCVKTNTSDSLLADSEVGLATVRLEQLLPAIDVVTEWQGQTLAPQGGATNVLASSDKGVLEVLGDSSPKHNESTRAVSINSSSPWSWYVVPILGMICLVAIVIIKLNSRIYK